MSIVLTIALAAGLLIAYILSNYLYPFISSRADTSILPIIFLFIAVASVISVEFLYFAVVQWRIFRISKKYVVKRIEEEAKESLDNVGAELFEKINGYRFKLKYVMSNSIIDILYYSISFDEFMNELSIDNIDVADKIKTNIGEYLKDKGNFREYINYGLFGVLSLAILNPIIQYVQSVYLPSTALDINFSSIVVYLAYVLSFVIPVIAFDIFVRKFNFSKNRNDKKLLTAIYSRLTDYDFDHRLSLLERCKQLIDRF